LAQHLHSRKELEIRVDALQRPLAEVKEQLNAIRSGEVDALIVQRPEGSRIDSLTGAEQP
jgi:type II secretory pathway component PulL